MTEIVKELSGIPLALEQAGALIRDGEFSFSHFNSVYRTKYRQLMEKHPLEGFWTYDKNRVIMTILDMTYSTIASNPEQAALFDFIGVLGSWQIPISLIEGFQFTDIDDPSPAGRHLESLKHLFQNSSFLCLALRRLASLCLIKLKEENGRIKNFIIHRIMCQWCVDNVIATHKKSYIIEAAYGLAKGIFVPIATNHFAWDIGNQSVRRNYLAPLENCISLVQRYVLPDHLDLQRGRFSEAYVIIASHAGWAYLSYGLTREAIGYFHKSIELEMARASEEDVQWPDSEVSLSVLSGLARAYQKAGDLEKALEALNTALNLSEKLNDSTNETTVAIVSRIKEISERQGIAQRHHKSVVVASTSSKAGEAVQQSSTSQANFLQQNSPSLPIESDVEARDEEFDLGAEPLAHALRGAAYNGDEAVVVLLIGLPNVDVDSKDVYGRTPLWMAAWQGHYEIVNLLLNTGKVEVNTEDSRGRTPLGIVCQEAHEQLVGLLLDKGANINTHDVRPRNALQIASAGGNESIVKLLLDKCAKVGTQGKGYSNALQAASAAGHEPIVKLLLENGADINMEGGTYGTTLREASYKGHEQIVRLLLEKGADINTRDGPYGSALQIASAAGHEPIVNLLLENGADINTWDGLYGSALQAASYKGHEQIVRLLLDKGADINTWDGPYGSALQAASYKGHEPILKLLLNDFSLLASRYSKKGQWKDAEKLFMQIREVNTKWLGERHPSTLTSMANLASAWRFCGRKNDALLLIEECFELRGEVLGQEHPDTVSSFQTLTEWRRQSSKPWKGVWGKLKR